jgi:hypothetical protein
MKTILVLLILIFDRISFSQTCSNLNFQLQSETETTCFKQTMTMLHDRLGRDYLYVANKDDGLTIWDIQNLTSPNLVKQLSKLELGNLDAINLSQQGDFVYVALGNTFNTNEASGMAIVNVSNPNNAFIEDTFVLANSFGGSGIVETEGDFAYLGAMGNGLIILDISNKQNIQFISQFIPQINWPDVNQDSLKVNARGMVIREDTVYLCYDAGGFRIIDVSQKFNPIEIGRYSNPIMNNLPRAYNNITIDGNLAYIAVDYCGLEILDFSNVNDIQLTGWWNPYDCPNNNWFSSPVHANEIRLNKNCSQIFLSTGKSDMVVVDVSNPTMPDSCNFFGGISNNIGTWGVDVYENKLFLSYICTFGIPFASNWSGFKAITMNECSLDLYEIKNFEVKLFPNPTQNILSVTSKFPIFEICIFQVDGKEIYKKEYDYINSIEIDMEKHNFGRYLLEVKTNNGIEYLSFVKK